MGGLRRLLRLGVKATHAFLARVLCLNEGKLRSFFFYEKEAKSLWLRGSGNKRHRPKWVEPAAPTAARNKGLFASFSSEMGESYFLVNTGQLLSVSPSRVAGAGSASVRRA
jgi:hypothetical protein